jgi:RimJ/RimL family protein N-acetyltransferase
MSNEVVFQGNTKTNKNLLIRYPTIEDAQLMTEYINSLSYEKTYVSLQGEEITLEEETKSLQEILQNIKEEKAVFLLAFIDSKLVGMTDINMMKRVFNHTGAMGISIAKDYRGGGIGNIFLEVLLNETKVKLPKIKLIALEVFSNNIPAINMYKKYGFIEYGTLPRGVQYNNGLVDLIYMYKEL